MPFRLTQATFRGREDDGSETAATWIAAANTNWTQDVDTNFRARFLVQESGGGTSSGNVYNGFQYRLNSGTWTNITGSSSVVQFSSSIEISDGGFTTQQLGSGSFNAGWLLTSATWVSSITFLSGNDEVENEICIKIIGADVSDSDSIELRCIGQDTEGTVFQTYSNIPNITANKATASFVDFTSDLSGSATADSNVQGIKQVNADLDATALVDSNVQGIKQLDSSIEANAFVDGDLTVQSPASFVDIESDISASALIDANAQISKPLASDLDATATVESNAQIIKQVSSDLDASATVSADTQIDKQISSGIEGNAFVDADLDITSPGAPSFVDFTASIEANAVVDPDLQGVKQVASDMNASATLESALEIVQGKTDVDASLEGNATVTGDLQVDKQLSSSIEGNATLESDVQGVKQPSADLEGNATISADLEVTVSGGVTVDLNSSIEGNATVSGEAQVDHPISSSIEGNATILASLSLVEEAIEEVTKGGWLPKEEVRKLLKIRRDLDRKVRDQQKQKDEEQREQQRELERIFNRINGIEEVSEELDRIVEPFIQKAPETAEALESQPQMPQVNFEALATQTKMADKLRQLADRLDQQRLDDEDAIALLLLV